MTIFSHLRLPIHWSTVLRRLFIVVAACALPTIVNAQIGSNNPTDEQLLQQRVQEVSRGFDVQPPPAGKVLRPVERVPRKQFGVVGQFPLTLEDLHALVYPSLTDQERQAILEGMTFFTTPHTPAEGAGPMANQPFCMGCHENSAESVSGVVSATDCVAGSICASNVTRAARSTPTNFKFTALDPTTGGGRSPDHLDAVNDTGKTAAFTIFSDFSPSLNVQDPLDGAFVNPVSHVAQPFGGLVQHVRPSIPECLAKPLPTIEEDANLVGVPDSTNLFPSGFRRSVAERAGPPYIGRGLIEAVPTMDILSNEDPSDTTGHQSSLSSFASSMGCSGDCITGRHNEIPARGGFVGGVGRFGLRANGVEILQFVTGGLQGELSFASLLNNHEINFARIDLDRPGCDASGLAIPVVAPEVHLSTPFSERNFLRNTALPEFGEPLLKVLQSPKKRHNPNSKEGMVQRGAELFGIDLEAFADRMIAGRMPSSGDDGLDPHAINQKDRKLNCAGCHTPVQRTGASPADVGAEHLSNVWAPLFSDLLIHGMPVIEAERVSTRPRDPLVISRSSRMGHDQDGDDNGFLSADSDSAESHTFSTFDLIRNLADDSFTNQQGSATGRDFRTAPLMGLGRIGPPFLHDARVFLSQLTRDSAPAGTVTSNSKATNAPLVVRTVDDAILAAIELHDLPAPDDERTPVIQGSGCPVPPAGASNVFYGLSPESVICPRYDSSASRANRGEAREVIRRFHALSPDDQKALIEFLKQL